MSTFTPVAILRMLCATITTTLAILLSVYLFIHSFKEYKKKNSDPNKYYSTSMEITAGFSFISIITHQILCMYPPTNYPIYIAIYLLYNYILILLFQHMERQIVHRNKIMEIKQNKLQTWYSRPNLCLYYTILLTCNTLDMILTIWTQSMYCIFVWLFIGFQIFRVYESGRQQSLHINAIIKVRQRKSSLIEICEITSLNIIILIYVAIAHFFCNYGISC